LEKRVAGRVGSKKSCWWGDGGDERDMEERMVGEDRVKKI
jgi:hypothetical protein